jgi:hypothetical protein
VVDPLLTDLEAAQERLFLGHGSQKVPTFDGLGSLRLFGPAGLESVFDGSDE